MQRKLRERYRIQTQLTWHRECELVAAYLRRWGRGKRTVTTLVEVGAAYGDFSPFLFEFLVHYEGTRHYLVEREPDCWPVLDALACAVPEYRVIKSPWPEQPVPFIKNESVEMVVMRLVCHEAGNDSLAMFTEAYRVLAPGGIIVVIDIDDGCWGLAWPHQEAMSWFQNAARQVSTEFGQNRFIARHFPNQLRTAGFKSVEFEAVVTHSDIENRELMLELLYATGLEELGALDQRFKALSESAVWLSQQFREVKESILMLEHFVALGVKAR